MDRGADSATVVPKRCMATPSPRHWPFSAGARNRIPEREHLGCTVERHAVWVKAFCARLRPSWREQATVPRCSQEGLWDKEPTRHPWGSGAGHGGAAVPSPSIPGNQEPQQCQPWEPPPSCSQMPLIQLQRRRLDWIRPAKDSRPAQWYPSTSSDSAPCPSVLVPGPG